jgi:GH24 family phage-related lysozyme (muramidase)
MMVQRYNCAPCQPTTSHNQTSNTCALFDAWYYKGNQATNWALMRRDAAEAMYLS